MLEFFEKLAASSDFMPHAECLLWDKDLLALHVVSDLLTGLAYYIIAAVLIYFTAKRRDIPFSWIILFFCAFIFSCGTTHIMSVWTLYVPSYWAEGIIKLANAVISIGATIAIFFLMPKIIQVPGLKRTSDALKSANEQLQDEISRHKLAAEELQRTKATLQAAMDQSPAGIAIADVPGGNLRYVNDAGLMIRGGDRQTIVNGVGIDQYVKSWQLMDFDGRPLDTDEVPLARAILYGETCSREFIVRRSSQEDRIVMANAAPIRNEEGKVVSAIVVFSDITEEKSAERNLLKQKAEFQAIINSIGDAIVFVDLQRRIVMINPAFTEMYGYTLEEVAGRTTEMLYADPEAFRRLGKQRYNPEAVTRQPVYEVEYRRKDGTVFTSETLGEKVLDEQGQLLGFLGVMRDISERKKAEERILQEQARAQKYLDVAGVMFCALNAAGEITLINKKGCEILQIEEQEVLGKNWFDNFIPDRQREEVREVFSKILAGQLKLVEFYENRIVTATGVERTIAFHNTLVTDDHGEISGVLFSGEDITEIRKEQAEKAKLEEQLRQSYKMEAIGTMAGGIAHDFNNILAIIIGNTDLAMDDISAQTSARKNLEQVMAAADRAKDLVRQILAFSRKEKQELIALKPQVLFKETLKLLRSTTPATVSIIQEISEDCGMIMADPTQLHQVLINLFSNAVQAMNEKGEIIVNLQGVELDDEALADKPWLSPGRYARLTVTDSGSGMDEQTLKRIFDPFFTTKEIGQGTGMGLSVTHGIVESHGGMIKVSSTPGEGSTFRVYFPIAGEDGKESSSATAEQEILPTGSEHILFVDDEEDLVTLGRRILEHLGYRVTTATSSVMALENFLADPDGFDLLLTDQSMPIMSGLELVEKIHEIRPSFPTVICSGFSNKISEENAGNFGIRTFCQKPLNRKDLAILIRKVLDEADGNRE